MDNTDEARKKTAETYRRIYDATHHVSRVKDIPAEPHYAVLCEETLNYDSGYGERGTPDYSTHNYFQYIKFDNDEALQAWIIANHQKKTFKVFSIRPVDFELKTVLNIRD